MQYMILVQVSIRYRICMHLYSLADVYYQLTLLYIVHDHQVHM